MSHANLAGKRVLVVEDEFLVSLIVEDALSDAGCIIVGPFARVQEALAAVRAEILDLAVLDVNVAGEMVFPVAHLLQERGTPFLFVTGYGQAALPKDQFGWEACTKPLQSGQLLDRLSLKVKPS